MLTQFRQGTNITSIAIVGGEFRPQNVRGVEQLFGFVGGQGELHYQADFQVNHKAQKPIFLNVDGGGGGLRVVTLTGMGT